MTADQADQIIERLDKALTYLDAMNTVLVSCQGFLISIFWILSIVGGFYIGVSLWRRR